MIEINYKQLGKKIKERRKDLKITQERLAADLNVNPSHISNIENARSYPSLTALFTISNSLECGIDYLIGDQYIFEAEPASGQYIDKKLAKALQYCSRDKKEKLLKIIELL